MSDFGVICEFNPFHSGHLHLFDEARRRGAKRIVCIMSGNTVQRGEFAMADKYVRAEAAVRCGADLVLELPYPWSAASAPYFATAGIHILCDYSDVLIFGSETGEGEPLRLAAEAVDSDEFLKALRERTACGEGAAAVYADELERRGFFRPEANDLLGIEYMRALKKRAPDFQTAVIKRIGAGYRTLVPQTGERFQSAGTLRRLWQEGEQEICSRYMPADAFACLMRAEKSGEITDFSRLQTAMLAYFRLKKGADLNGIAECSGGLGERICAAAYACDTWEKWMETVRTKCYTDAHIRRAVLYAMTGVTGELLRTLPHYTQLLAANEEGRALLAKKRRSEKKIPVITKPADVPKDSAQYDAGDRADSLFTLARKTPSSAAGMHRRRAVIL